MVHKEYSGSIGTSHEYIQIEWKLYFPFDFVIWKTTRADSYESCAFNFAGSKWQLVLRPKSEECPDFYGLQLYGALYPKPVEYKFGLKRVDGNVEPLVSGVLEKYGLQSECHNVINMRDIFERKDELVETNTLNVVCTLKCGNELNFKISEERDFTKVEKINSLSINLKDLMSNEDSCDAILQVEEKQFKVHSQILRSRSRVFDELFKCNTSERQNDPIDIPDCNSETFHDFLEFLYTGKLYLVSYSQAIHLYQTSDKYDVQELKDCCVNHLMKCLTTENVCVIARFANLHGEAALFSTAQDFFNKNKFKIFESSEWKSLLLHDSILATQLLKNMSANLDRTRSS